MSSIVTAAITAGALIGYWQVDPPRPDPFTSTDGTELRREFERKIAEAEKRLTDHMHKTEKQLGQRMLVIERTDETIQQTQREMWEVIRDLPPDTFESEFRDLENRVRGLEIWIIKKDNSYEVPE